MSLLKDGGRSEDLAEFTKFSMLEDLRDSMRGAGKALDRGQVAVYRNHGNVIEAREKKLLQNVRS